MDDALRSLTEELQRQRASDPDFGRRWREFGEQVRNDPAFTARVMADPAGACREADLGEAAAWVGAMVDRVRRTGDAARLAMDAWERAASERSRPFATDSTAHLIRLGIIAEHAVERVRPRTDEELGHWGDPSEWQERLASLRGGGALWARAVGEELRDRRPPTDPEKRASYDRALLGLRRLAALADD